MNQDVVEKIKKCLALAEGRNATPAEMEVAMAKAMEIAVRHNIDLADIDTSMDTKSAMALEIETDETLKTSSKYEQPHHKFVWALLQDIFGVTVIRTKSSTYNGVIVHKITIIGEATDVAISKLVYVWLEAAFPRTMSKAVAAGKLRYCAADMNGCYMGLRNGIILANGLAKQNLEEDDKNKYALVVRNKEELIQEKVAEAFPKLKSPKARKISYHHDAFEHGRAEGMKIKLRNQVGAGANANQIR